MKIIRVAEQKYRKNHRTVYLESGDPLKLHAEVVAQNGLEEGVELDPTRIEALRRSSARKEALDYAFMLLGYRGLSEKGLAERLRRKGFDADLALEVVEELKKNRLLDDARLARDMAENRLKNRLVGESRVEQDLLKRGLDRSTVRDALKSVSEEPSGIPDEEARAYALLMKRAGQIRAPDPRTLYRRLFEFMARRGFGPDAIEKALNRYRRESRESDKISEATSEDEP